jgi:alpha-ribazole phosphatase
MVSKLYLLRHGKTALSGKFVGSTEVDLIPDGIKQIQMTRPLLAKAGIQRIFCSPMRRCRESARHIALYPEVTFLEDLREIDFGRWEGKDFSEIKKTDPELIRQWLNDPAQFCFPEGECRIDFIERIERVKNILQNIKNTKILIISHGGVIRHLLCSLLGLSYNNYLLFKINEGGFSTLDYFPEGGVLTGLNIDGVQ